VNRPAQPRKKGPSGYFWLMVCLYAILAIGLWLLAAGLLSPHPPQWFPRTQTLL